MKTGTRIHKTVEVTTYLLEKGVDFTDDDIEPFVNGLKHLSLGYRDNLETMGLGKLLRSGSLNEDNTVTVTFEKELFV